MKNIDIAAAFAGCYRGENAHAAPAFSALLAARVIARLTTAYPRCCRSIARCAALSIFGAAHRRCCTLRAALALALCCIALRHARGGIINCAMALPFHRSRVSGC